MYPRSCSEGHTESPVMAATSAFRVQSGDKISNSGAFLNERFSSDKVSYILGIPPRPPQLHLRSAVDYNKGRSVQEFLGVFSPAEFIFWTILVRRDFVCFLPCC